MVSLTLETVKPSLPIPPSLAIVPYRPLDLSKFAQAVQGQSPKENLSSALKKLVASYTPTGIPPKVTFSRIKKSAVKICSTASKKNNNPKPFSKGAEEDQDDKTNEDS